MSPTVWLVRVTRGGKSHVYLSLHNSIANWRDIDPSATSTKIDLDDLLELLAADRGLDAAEKLSIQKIEDRIRWHDAVKRRADALAKLASVEIAL